ncbi:MAG: peptidylprolyl isomerase [Opitutae bacterium]|nr:peptidylprolyl isomerase [Opitutae bacterium]
MRRLLLLLALLAAPLFAAEPSAAPLPDGLYAEFTTSRGTFTAQLFFEQAPMTVASFVGRAEGSLAPRSGKPFFTGLKWYRVVPNFVLQSGDPTNPGGGIQDRPPQSPADEAAGHALPFPDEIVPGLHHADAGVLSMANGGPDTNSSEFFVTLRETNRLNYLHSVFGRVVRGLEVLPQIQPDDAFSIQILRVGAAARAFRADEAAFAALVAAAKKYALATEPGPAAHFDDPDKLLPQDVPRAKNFNFKLANFERFTGKKIYARVFKAFRPEHEGQKLGAFHSALAERLGVKERGVLVSYFADRDTWMIWIGEDLLPAFVGRAGTHAELVESGLLMKRKESFIAVAKQRGNEVADRAKAEGREVSDAQRLKLTVDEVLDAFIFLSEGNPHS